MRSAIILALIFALPFAAADYFVAVPDDAPATDVVFAANFAAAMKQAENVEFSGRTESDMREFTAAELAGHSVLHLDGQERTARIVVGSAASSKHRRVAESAADYLESKGYDVTITNSDEPARDPPASREEPERAPDEDEGNDGTPSDTAREQPPAAPQPAEQEKAEPQPPAEPLENDLRNLEAEKPGVVQRFVGWLKGLFS